MLKLFDLNKPYEHRSHNGTIFKAKRASLDCVIKVSSEYPIKQERVYSDFAEFAGWYAVNVYPELRESGKGFSGFDCLNYDCSGLQIDKGEPEVEWKKLEVLFIRACKAREPMKRCASVYKRFYYRSIQADFYEHLSVILKDITDKYVTFNLSEFITELSPRNDWKHTGEENHFYKRVAKQFIKAIRFTSNDEFPESMPIPLRFRNK